MKIMGKQLNKCQNKIDRKHFAVSFFNKLLSKENLELYYWDPWSIGETVRLHLLAKLLKFFLAFKLLSFLACASWSLFLQKYAFGDSSKIHPINRLASGVLSNIDHQTKNPNIDQISTTQHFIDQISTAKFP